MAREELSKGPSARDRSDLRTGSHLIPRNLFAGTFWSPITAVFITAGVPDAAAMSKQANKEREGKRERTEKGEVERRKEGEGLIDIYAGISERVREVRQREMRFWILVCDTDNRNQDRYCLALYYRLYAAATVCLFFLFFS